MTSVSVSLTILSIDEEQVTAIISDCVDCNDIQHDDIKGVKITTFNFYDIKNGELTSEKALEEAKIPYEKCVGGCYDWDDYTETAKLTKSFSMIFDNYATTKMNMVEISKIREHIIAGDLEEFIELESKRYVFDWATQESYRTNLLNPLK
ncbi:hypothetical protein [Photobacterium damselae]|uniref:hypothetical protein n=1 Tax=Photobacterium damselae TaxID=38293 RepID=UPI0040682F69